jgi:hypothetical protein
LGGSGPEGATPSPSLAAQLTTASKLTVQFYAVAITIAPRARLSAIAGNAALHVCDVLPQGEIAGLEALALNHRIGVVPMSEGDDISGMTINSHRRDQFETVSALGCDA